MRVPRAEAESWAEGSLASHPLQAEQLQTHQLDKIVHILIKVLVLCIFFWNGLGWSDGDGVGTKASPNLSQRPHWMGAMRRRGVGAEESAFCSLLTQHRARCGPGRKRVWLWFKHPRSETVSRDTQPPGFILEIMVVYFCLEVVCQQGELHIHIYTICICMWWFSW